MDDFKSPTKSYKLQISDVKTPPKWKRPEEVMRQHLRRMKHKALQDRINNTNLAKDTQNLSRSIDTLVSKKTPGKRKNPFCKTKEEDLKKIKSISLEESSNSSTVFNLLNTSANINQLNETQFTSFKNLFSHPTEVTHNANQNKEKKEKGSVNIPVDWKLRTKIRLMSHKPFFRNSKLKTCEEASGTTAFVRCLDPNSNIENCSLDTSGNAKFHQCCLVWQHPVLPWVELYPRNINSKNVASSLFASNNSLRDALHSAWAESFRSLFQLVRAQQCPYFYVVANTFTCLFRAAGICGHSEINALVTPTTRGFRQALKDEDIEFVMPLKETNENKRRSFENQTDTGYNTLDENLLNNTEETNEKEEIDKEEEDLKNKGDDEDYDDEEWLQSMGVDESEIKRISVTHNENEFGKEKQIDKLPESLVYVEGVEAQALFNFLLNCKSNTAATGPLAGIPPTLLSPVAFHGATLRPLNVRHSVVNVGIDQYYTIEIRGPILPQVVSMVCHLLRENLDTYSLTFASLESTNPFTLMHQKRHALEKSEDAKNEAKEKLSNLNSSFSIPAFGEVNLSDCGLLSTVLSDFCKSNTDAVQSYDSIKYADNSFTWSI